jgi:hypothetical protein
LRFDDPFVFRFSSFLFGCGRCRCRVQVSRLNPHLRSNLKRYLTTERLIVCDKRCLSILVIRGRLRLTRMQAKGSLIRYLVPFSLVFARFRARGIVRILHSSISREPPRYLQTKRTCYGHFAYSQLFQPSLFFPVLLSLPENNHPWCFATRCFAF